MEHYQAENIGTIIAAKRKAMGMTQETLAKRLQITPQAISKWENGTGLPDLTLIPRIAAALECSPNELFGENTKRSKLPKQYEGMPLIVTDGRVALYSSKSVQSESDGTVYFTDGSEANLSDETVINRGAGEVRILQISDEEWFDGTDTVVRRFTGIRSLELSNSTMCTFTVEKGTDGETVLEATGSKRFLSRLEIADNGGTLRVNARSAHNADGSEQGNRVKIKCGFEAGEQLIVHISGCGDAKIEPFFSGTEIAISGSGSVGTNGADDCTVKISGSGNVAATEIRKSLSVKISGSGNVACTDVRNVTVKISGSGNLAVMRMDGFLDAAVSGCGSLACSGGEVEKLTLGISGSGSLSAEALTVGDADIHLRGNGSVSLGRIKGTSVERLSKNSRLTVKQRG